MKKERDPYWECVKGIAILAIVVGHGYALLHDFVYAWHLPVFFFVSGWFYNEKKYGDYPELNSAVRIKNNLPKYFTYSCILIMLHLVLQNILGVETLKERFSLGSAVIYSLESVVFKANDYLAGSMWFVPFLILSSSFWGIIVYISRGKIIKKYKNILIIGLSILVGALGCVLNAKEIEIAGTYQLQIVMKIVPLYTVAYYARLYDAQVHGLKFKWYIALVCFAVTIILPYGVGVGVGMYAPWYSFYILGLSGIYMVLFLCKWLCKFNLLKTIFSMWGRYSFEIMAFNVLIFFLLNYLFEKMGFEKNAFSLCEFQQLWIIYLSVLMFLPCIVGVLYDKCKVILFVRE